MLPLESPETLNPCAVAIWLVWLDWFPCTMVANSRAHHVRPKIKSCVTWKRPISDIIQHAPTSPTPSLKTIKLAGDFDGLGTHGIALEIILKTIGKRKRPDFEAVFG